MSRTAQGKWKIFRRRRIAEAGSTPACHWCGGALNPKAARGEPGAIELDHLLPVSIHPELEFDRANVVLACAPCNKHRGNRIGQQHTAVTTAVTMTHVQPRAGTVCRVHGTGDELTRSCPHSVSLQPHAGDPRIIRSDEEQMRLNLEWLDWVREQERVQSQNTRRPVSAQQR